MDTVQVAVRVRPLVPHETESGCRSCIDVIPEANQIVTKLKHDRFTFNHVFDGSTPQVDVYENAIRHLVFQLFKGYNVTVLAYGQTGSGKTFSMGTCPCNNETDIGIIPRAISDIFDIVTTDEERVFKISVSFLELYNEQLIDLLSDKNQAVVELREGNQGILIPGLTQCQTQSADDIMRCLQQGSSVRTTGATAMNSQSSRSHAIFTIYIHQSKKGSGDDAMSAKFHLVDLAGSERSKRTKAEGKRFQEGVNINKELFVLGNVISALGDGAPFVNYRDSKLTRLLQDSLGGNALTLMLACVSPADSNLDETINTLRYADRARKIKNKPVVNQDPAKQEINRLKREIEDLHLALLSKQGEATCPPEHQELKEKNKQLMEKHKLLSVSLDGAVSQITTLLERASMAESARDRMKAILSTFSTEFAQKLETMDVSWSEEQKNNFQAVKNLLDGIMIEHEKSEIERIKFDEQICNKAAPMSNPALDVENSPEDQEEDDTRDIYVLKQVELNQAIFELDKNLAWKEALAVKLTESNSMEASIKVNNEEDIEDLKTQINSLLAEKDELEQQLKQHRNSKIEHKLAEQRRLRVKELEEKINGLNKKILDQDRIIKMKEKNEEKIKVLNKEIMDMKRTKVNLINKMKSESENYRKVRSIREQEMYRLRQQNRQKETKFVKMENYYIKQQNVYKRKLEESSAVIKRLKDTLALQKSSKEKRSFMGNAEKVSQWVSQEFSAMVNAMEAERTLENLIEDRTLLAKELSSLKDSLSDESLTEEDKIKINDQIKSLNENLELRSTQILDLKQKLQSLDSYQENKSKTRLDCMQTMADAKTALKYVFETANSYLNDFHKDKSAKEIALNELQESYQAVLLQLQEKEVLLKEESRKLKDVERDYNDRLVVLLGRLRKHEKGEHLNAYITPLQEGNTDNAQQEADTKQYIQKLEQKIEELQKQSAELMGKKKTQKPKTSVLSDNFHNVITPETRKRFFEEEEDDDLDLDDNVNDPDWRKTPVYRKLQSIKAGTKPNAVKRNIDGQPTCSCKGECSTRLCSCKKLNHFCSGNCNCGDATCKNKENFSGSNDNTNNDSTSDDSDISFKKPR